MEELKNVKIENDTETEVVVEESKIKKFVSKVGNGVKKHGKKIAIGAVVVGGTVLGYALGKGSTIEIGDYYEEGTDDYEVSSEEESE